MYFINPSLHARITIFQCPFFLDLLPIVKEAYCHKHCLLNLHRPLSQLKSSQYSSTPPFMAQWMVPIREGQVGSHPNRYR